MTRFQIRKKLHEACSTAKYVAFKTLGQGQVKVSQNRQIKTLLALGAVSVLPISCLTFQAEANAAGIKRIDQSAFTPEAGLITFSEFALNTTNPTYLPSNYGGGPNSPIVNFGGIFQGQTVNVPPFPSGAASTGVVNGTPTGSLTLNPSSPATFITTDGANPTSPVLSGSPRFNGAVSVLFDRDLAGVGLDGGFFDAIGGTAIRAFARDGSLLGSVVNQATGIEFLGLVTDDGLEKIAGLQFSLVGSEPAGFAIDNLRFGRAGQVNVPGEPVPEPLTILGSFAAGSIGVALRRKYQQQKDSAKV